MEEKLTIQRIEELTRLEKAAGPAPWRAGRSDTTSYTGSGIGPYKNVYGPRNEPEKHLGHDTPLEEAQGWGEQCIENAQLIAAMRNDLPALLEAARRDADVRTLDDWAERHPQFPFILQRGEAEETDRWCCWREGRISERCYFYGATPAEARSKAADWFRSQSATPPGESK